MRINLHLPPTERMGDFKLIKDIRQGMKNINVTFIILEISHPTVTKENREVRTCKVADISACINVSIWDEAGQILVPGDIVRLTKGYTSIWRNCLTLYSGKNGDIQKINDFCMVFNEQLNMSEPIPVLGQLGHPNQMTGPASNNIISGNNILNANNNGSIINRHSAPIVQAPPANITQTNSISLSKGNGGRFGNEGKTQGKGNPRVKGAGHRNGSRNERR